jgi:hypothetical protein
MSVTFSAAAAGGDNLSFAGLFQISQKLAGFMISNDRPDGDFDYTVFAAPAVAVTAHTIAAAAALH